MRFKIAIVGNGEKEPALESDEGQELIGKLCEGFLPRKEISPELFEKFRRVNAIREENGNCYLNFTCFTATDIETLNRECDLTGGELANAILEKVSLDSPGGLSFEEVSWKKYLFFIVGCVCLDWYALQVLEEMGLTLPEAQKEKPGYGNYTLFGNENIPQNLEKLYWGSHSWKYGGFWFTTFGDHAGIRKAFPDVSWMISLHSRDDLVTMISSKMVDNYMRKISRHVVERSWIGTEYQEVLEKLHYVREDRLLVPVLIKRDIGKISPLISDVMSVLREWLVHQAESLRERFKDLTPVRSGVDFREVMIQIWHYVFGHANKHLSFSEDFFDPYSQESGFKGFLPVVHESGCFF